MLPPLGLSRCFRFGFLGSTLSRLTKAAVTPFAVLRIVFIGADGVGFCGSLVVLNLFLFELVPLYHFPGDFLLINHRLGVLNLLHTLNINGTRQYSLKIQWF